MANIRTQWRKTPYTYIHELIIIIIIIILLFFFFLLTHILNINKRVPLRIRNEMDILSNNDVHELPLTK